MGVLPAFMKEEEPAGTTSEYASPDAAAPQPPATIASSPLPFDDTRKDGDEESVDQYMARLLQRMQGSSAPRSSIVPHYDSPPDQGGEGAGHGTSGGPVRGGGNRGA